MTTTLQARLRHLGWRVVAIGLATGFGWGLVAGPVLVLACAWLDLLWDLPPGLRAACGLIALAVPLLVAGIAGRLAWRRSVPRHLARRLDHVAGSGGQILSGVELALEQPLPTPLTAGLAALAVDRAERLAAAVPRATAVPVGPVVRSLAGLALLGLVVVLVVLTMPRLAWTQWRRFTDPFAEETPFARVVYHVQPGDVRVVYGEGFEVHVSIEGAPVDRLELVLQQDEAAQAEILPMFQEPSGAWRALIASVTAPGRYHVRSHAGRSPSFQIQVVTVPRLEAVRFRITPPAYTLRGDE